MPDFKYIRQRENGSWRCRIRQGSTDLSFTSKDLEEVKRRRNKELGYDPDIMDNYLLSERLDGFDGASSSDIEEALLVFRDKKEVEDVDWREIIELANVTGDMMHGFDDSQRTAEIEVKTNKPFGVVYTSDWHLGDGYTDHRVWQRDIELIMGCPYLKLADLGDDRQNTRTFKVLASVLGQSLSPPLQAKLMRGIVDELTGQNKLAFKVDGNHDTEFDERIFGESLQTYLLEKMECPRFVNRGLVKLYVGDQLYTNLVFHKSRFRSFLRATHGAMREYQLSYPADVVAGGHDHDPGFEMHHHYTLARESGMGFGGDSFLIKLGAYQDNKFGWKYFHNGGFPWSGVVIYWPNEFKKLFMPDIKMAIDYLNYLNENG